MFRIVIIKTGQVTEEELVKQIDHISKIRGDTVRLLKCFKGLFTSNYHSANCPSLFFFFFFLTNSLEIRFLSSPFSAPSGDSTHLLLSRYTLWPHVMGTTMVRATHVGGFLPSLSSSPSHVFLPTSLRYRLLIVPIIQMQKLRAEKAHPEL